jgi:hypothetical protein
MIAQHMDALNWLDIDMRCHTDTRSYSRIPSMHVCHIQSLNSRRIQGYNTRGTSSVRCNLGRESKIYPNG